MLFSLILIFLQFYFLSPLLKILSFLCNAPWFIQFFNISHLLNLSDLIPSPFFSSAPHCPFTALSTSWFFLLLISRMISSAARFFQLLHTPIFFSSSSIPSWTLPPLLLQKDARSFFCSFLLVRKVFSCLSFELGRGQLPKEWHHSLALQGKWCRDPSESWQVSCLLLLEVTECFTHHLSNKYWTEHTDCWLSLFSSFPTSLKSMRARIGMNHRVFLSIVFLSIAELYLKKTSLVVMCAFWGVHG